MSDNASEKDIMIRDSSRNRLQRLGALYSNADNLSSPIHRTENKFYEENSESHESVSTKKSRQGLGKLAALADSIKSWEDDTSHPDFKNEYKQQSQQQHHQPSQQQYTSDSDNKHQQSSIEDNNTPSKNTKHLKWDKSVMDSLEAQGFQRRESSTTKLSYDYGNNTKTTTTNSTTTNSTTTATTKHTTAQIHNQHQQQQQKAPSEISSTQSNSGIVTPEIKTGLVSSKTAVFENKCTKSPLKQKDPAEMPLKERMMLFERNKGQAPLPKTMFPLPRTPIPPKIKTTSATIVGETRKLQETPHSTNVRTDLKGKEKMKEL